MGVPGILGLGYRLPDATRGNDDRLFDWLRQHSVPGEDLFYGYRIRHVVRDDAEIVGLVQVAATRALDAAGRRPDEVDLLLGGVSLSRHIVPSDLFAVHAALGLRRDVLAIPLGNDFSNFGAALVLADAMIRAGRIRTALVAIGGDWTRAMDYRLPWSLGAGDGAAAAVVGLPRKKAPRWVVVDQEVIALPTAFGDMTMVGDIRRRPVPDDGAHPEDEDWTGPYFHITAKGQKEFGSFGVETAPRAVKALLERQGIDPGEVTVIGHQAARGILDAWKASLAPSRLVETLEAFGNMTIASIPVTLAHADDTLVTPFLVLLALGPDMHVHALLLRRGGAPTA
nr:3-oxoacyl-[acyl-carrier-protein] synthase III C-terminal domain-containing protein [Roseomonas acroporae]